MMLLPSFTLHSSRRVITIGLFCSLVLAWTAFSSGQDPDRSVTGLDVDVLVAAEARGFIFAAPLAVRLGVGFVPIRKPGKLPFDTHSFHYELEYGSDTLEMHVDGVLAGQRVLVVDDLLATGGTVKACCNLLEQVQAKIIGCVFAIELTGLGGAKVIAPHPVFSLLKYD